MGLAEPRARHEVTVSHRRQSTYTLECTHDGRASWLWFGRVNDLADDQAIALVAGRARSSDVQLRSTARTSRRGKV